jgi:hypothetical protein
MMRLVGATSPRHDSGFAASIPKKSWAIVESYHDRAASGASLLRPGIQSLIRDAMRGTFDGVLDRYAPTAALKQTSQDVRQKRYCPASSTPADRLRGRSVYGRSVHVPSLGAPVSGLADVSEQSRRRYRGNRSVCSVNDRVPDPRPSHTAVHTGPNLAAVVPWECLGTLARDPLRGRTHPFVKEDIFVVVKV